MTVRRVDGGTGAIPFNDRRQEDTARVLKNSGKTLIPFSEVKYHDTNRQWVVDAEGTAYRHGHDSIALMGGDVLAVIENADAYAINDQGRPVFALKQVSRDELHDWEQSAASATRGAQIAKERQQAIVDEYLARKQRDYSVVTIPGTILKTGVHLPTLREHLDTVGVSVTKDRAGRVLCSFPAGPSPLRREASRYADIAARFGDLILDKKATCGVPRCTRPGDWVTAGGSLICDKHADK